MRWQFPEFLLLNSTWTTTRACMHLAFIKENSVNYKRNSSTVKCMVKKQARDKIKLEYNIYT